MTNFQLFVPKIFTAALVSLLICNASNAYEIDVHVSITGLAVSQSSNYTAFINNFGLDGFSSIKNGSAFEDSLFPIVRPRHHFYDPTTGQGICSALCLPSLEWGFKYDGSLLIAANEYSWTKARENMYIALTGENFNGDLVASTADQRNDYFQKMFRSAGQVMHLVEDLASPAHVRNDPHIPIPGPLAGDLYEKYTLNFFDYSWLLGYGTIKLNQFSDFWNSPKGLAVFTNKNLISQNTNFDNFDGNGNLYYPSPQINGYMDTEEKIVDQFGHETTVKVEYGRNVVYDEYAGTSFINDRLTALSVFDFEAQELLGRRVHSVNDNTMASAAYILIPRAVGYSAGLLDYFFRGKLANPKYVTFDPSDRTKVSFNVFNETPDEVAGPGTLAVLATYKPYDGASEVAQLSHAVDVTTVPRPDQGGLPSEFVFNIPFPYTVKDLKFTVVFRGKLGLEDDAVMGYVFTPKQHHVFVIQDTVTLGSNASIVDFICAYPTCSSDILTILYNRERRRIFETTSLQTMTGRFDAHGEIKRIDLLYNNGVSTFSGSGKLFINDQEIVKGYWLPGDTQKPPATWRVLVDPVQGGAVTYLLNVRMGDESTYTLGLASYLKFYKEIYKEWGTPNCGICSISLFVFTYTYAEMGVGLGYWLMPGLSSIASADQWELVQLSSTGLNAGHADSRQEVISDENMYAVHTYRELLSMGLARYTEEEAFLCDPCAGKINVDSSGEGEVYAEDLYVHLPLPDFIPMSLTGHYHRVYTQAELDALSALEIEPVQYDLILN